jgi:polar amino acid transport system substrate-binding protein
METFKYVMVLIVSTALMCANAEPLLVFARNEKLPEQDVAEIVFKKIMANLHLATDIVPLPPARAAFENENGTVDGEIARIESYGIKHPSLLRVEPSYYYLTSVAFAKKSRHIKISNTEDLKNYRIGILLGVQHGADLVADLINVDKVRSSEILFGMLQKGRIDIAITTDIDGEINLKKMALEGEIEPVADLARLDLYIYLNKKNSGLTVELSKEIERMKKSGELSKIIEEAEASQ